LDSGAAHLIMKLIHWSDSLHLKSRINNKNVSKMDDEIILLNW
jgi:hypothetical protein